MGALRRPQVVIMKPVHIMAGVKNHKRVIDLPGHTQSLAYAYRVAELPEQKDQPRAVEFQVFGFVQNDRQPVGAAGQQEPAQRFVTLRRVEGAAWRLVEHADHVLSQRNKAVDYCFVFEHALETAVFGVGQVAGEFHIRTR